MTTKVTGLSSGKWWMPMTTIRRAVTSKQSEPQINAHSLFLWATNTGELYPTMKEMARQASSLYTWRYYVEHVIYPKYRREIEKQHASNVTLDALAVDLKNYYERHIKE